MNLPASYLLALLLGLQPGPAAEVPAANGRGWVPLSVHTDDYLALVQETNPGLAASLSANERVVGSALIGYIHGITPEDAERRIGAEGVPTLL